MLLANFCEDEFYFVEAHFSGGVFWWWRILVVAYFGGGAFFVETHFLVEAHRNKNVNYKILIIT